MSAPSASSKVAKRASAPETVPYHGLPLDYRPGDQIATRAAFGEALEHLGNSLQDLVVLDGDVKNSTKTELFAEAFPERFFEGHIAEQNMIGAALGLAVSGKLPVAASFAAFLTRALDLPPAAGDTFVDDDGSVFAADIAALAQAGITRGCDRDGTRYCPHDPVTAQRLIEVGHLVDASPASRKPRSQPCRAARKLHLCPPTRSPRSPSSSRDH